MDKESQSKSKAFHLSDFQLKLLKLPVLDEFDEVRLKANKIKLNNSLKRLQLKT